MVLANDRSEQYGWVLACIRYKMTRKINGDRYAVD
jgi:hypothetical protein